MQPNYKQQHCYQLEIKHLIYITLFNYYIAISWNNIIMYALFLKKMEAKKVK